jgi:hypothetical protein
VRRLATWLAGAAGGLAAYRALTRRRSPASTPAPEPDDPVDELREKLAHARETEQEADPPADDNPDVRRRAVHEQGRAAIDDMRSGDPT